MKRILEMFGEPITYGGQESVVYNMLSTFRLGEDFTIDLFTPYFADNKKLIELVESHKGKVFSLKTNFQTNDNRFLLTKHIDDFFSKQSDYDVVHIHTGSLSTMCVYAKSAKKHNVKKVIVHAHSSNSKITFNYRIRRYLLCKILKKYVDVFLGCTKESIESKFVKEIRDRAIVVYNGIDVPKYRFNNDYRKEIRKLYDVEDKFVIGSVGRLSYEKNNYFMLDILKELNKCNKNIILMIVGTGDTEKALIDKSKELCIEDNVFFIGNINNVEKYYSAFDCFIFPSIFEGLGISSIEAQICGLPTFIADSITKEGRISNGTKYLQNNNLSLWASNIMDIYNENVREHNYDIDFDKYDRTKTFKIVENIYLDKC